MQALSRNRTKANRSAERIAESQLRLTSVPGLLFSDERLRLLTPQEEPIS